MADDDFRLAAPREIEQALQGPSPMNLYVFIKASSKHVLYVPAGEIADSEKRENLRKLSGTDLFVRTSDRGIAVPTPAPAPVAPAPVATSAPTTNALKAVAGAGFRGDILGEEAGTALQGAYKGLLDGTADPAKVSAQVAKMADDILSVVAPESQNLKTSILQSLKNLHFMNDTAAISSIAVLCAIGNDFRSRTALQQITQAVLLMDAALGELEPWQLTLYYKNRRELPQHILEKIKGHPVKSQQLVASMPIANDVVEQLILMHHELNNGEGYHRGIRTVSSLALGRVLCFAVDFYEAMRSAELNGAPLSFVALFQRFEERGVEPHLRRHGIKMIKGVADFLGIPFKAT